MLLPALAARCCLPSLLGKALPALHMCSSCITGLVPELRVPWDVLTMYISKQGGGIQEHGLVMWDFLAFCSGSVIWEEVGGVLFKIFWGKKKLLLTMPINCDMHRW